MERRTNDVCVKVDNRKFVLHPASKMTLDGVIAFLDVAIKTEQYEKMNAGMLLLIHSIIGTPREREEPEYDDQPEQW